MRYFKTLLLAGALAWTASASDTRAGLLRGFQAPPDDSRIMMRWWWFGPAVTHQQLEREMRLMKEGGIGGFEVQPVYPLRLEGNYRFLSAPFLEALRFTSEKATELGLRFDLTLGSGWPYGGPQIPLHQAAGRLRIHRIRVEDGGPVQVPALRPGESLVAAFAANKRGELPVTGGQVAVPDGVQEVWLFVSSHTRQMVKRASVGAEGYVLDHYSRTALDTYLSKVGEKLLEPLAGRMPTAIFCDSLEAFGSDWTPDLLDEFRRRRGYDLKPMLPALVGDIGPETAGVRHDWGQTLTELVEDRFLAPMQRWSHAKGVQFRVQGYGIPPASISSNTHADFSEGEGTQWRVVRASRWASSANHIYGRRVTTSETWTWLHSPVFRATPLDVKAEADLHFLQGVNQLIGHGWPYTAEGVEYPGARFYAAGVFNNSNPWWIAMPDVARYLQRVSHLLRQGRPANDVALYLPNSDAWSGFRAGRVHLIEELREHIGPDLIGTILDSGYGLDFVDDRTIQRLGRIESRTLVMGDGRYRVVVVPGAEFMPVQTLRKLEAFVKAGGVVIATRRLPEKAPGLRATEQEHREVRSAATRLLKTAVEDANLPAAIRRVLTPDVAIDGNQGEIGFVHRTLADGEVYFIANTTNVRQNRLATFRVGRELHPELWDPVRGTVLPIRLASRGTNSATVMLDLAPYASAVIVFSGKQPEVVPALQSGPSRDLSSGWRVLFPGRDAPVDMAALRSWTDDATTRFFSGTASYSRTFESPGLAARVVLDFGQGTAVERPPVDPQMRSGPGMRAWFDSPVREAAVVFVNGKRAGSVWSPPYELDVTAFLQPGKNELRVDVGNTAVNYMAGHPQPSYEEVHKKYGRRFDPQDMDRIAPVPSGLLGPITLRTYNLAERSGKKDVVVGLGNADAEKRAPVR